MSNISEVKLSLGKKLKVNIYDDRLRDALSFPPVQLGKKQKPKAAYGLKLSRTGCVPGNASRLEGFKRNRFKFQIDGAIAIMRGDLELFYQTPEAGKSSWI